jgi:hypothetical protein
MPRARNVFLWGLLGAVGLLVMAFALVVIAVITDWPWWPNQGPRIADTAARELMAVSTRRAAATLVACPPSVESDRIAQAFEAAHADECVFAQVWNQTDSDADQRMQIRCVDGRTFRVTFHWADFACPPPATGLVLSQLDTRLPEEVFHRGQVWFSVPFKTLRP